MVLRLDVQHDLLVKVSRNTLIHPSIPTGKVVSIADIATGTGIWLRDLSRSLSEVPGVQRYYHGFDISSAQFPPADDSIKFSVHDITVPFPEEHWNRYDLVHVRLLVAALAEPDYRAAVANIYQLLKPGGYMQWEEIDEETYIADNVAFQEIRRCFNLGLKAEGKYFQASAKVYHESQSAGFRDVVRVEYSSHWDAGLRPSTEQRFVAIIGTLYTSLLLRSAQVPDEEAASKKGEELIERFRQLCAQGESPPVKLMRVVGQKPLHEVV
ncbi:hypothetical protein ABOM_003398 [Aspergillus bombycis]|uniref:Methyltransferase domain-containing protein n=1 Tax=Aspergillus bombycis TaxID=109264 RepID=A0A1F8AAP8_9EURO|nr:hypothetical protein ABOM_003398 [Aspergillus bombycis]OGM48428.1 hypothetical protein ABOM_003398 [Aspergillus bombycis]